MNTNHRNLATLVLGVALAGCAAVGPDYKAPEQKLPEAWHEPADAQLHAQPVDVAQWWQKLDDPVLNDLVDRALREGLDLQDALSRIREARALRGVAAADRFPSLDATTSYQRHGFSKNTPLGEFVPDYGDFSIGVDTSWELDLWGRVRRSVEAADADLAARDENARAVAISVVAETALHYVELRGFQQRLSIAHRNVELQQQTLALVQGRLDAGLVGERDVAQAEANLETTRSRVPALEAGARASENRLAVLLGLAPGALAEELAAVRPIPVPPVEVAVGVPADLLRRRPDVRRAERVFAAETARIGVAEGDLYPRLTLSGNIGLEAEDLSDLLDYQSGVFSFGPSLRWNIFDFGRLRQRVEAQDARAEQARIGWERTVLGALEETENAMTAFVREQVRHAALARAATQARRAVDLAQSQYTQGLSDFQAVLDSQREVASLEDDLAQSDERITTDLVALYKSLGGGWESLDLHVAKVAKVEQT